MKLFVVLGVGLALTVLGIVWSGERTQVLVYAFILDYVLRLITIRLMLPTLAGGPPALAVGLAHLTTTPAPGEPSHPLTDEDTGQPVAFSAYIVIVLFLGTLTFVLANVNAQHQLDVDVAAVVRDLRWAGALAVKYWVEGLMTRTIVIDPAASAATNLGYNRRDLTLLTFAVLAAGSVVVTRQMARSASSGWVVLGPLLLFRFLFDFSAARRSAAR
jgi:hypothetical protein